MIGFDLLFRMFLYVFKTSDQNMISTCFVAGWQNTFHGPSKERSQVSGI